MNRAPKKPPRLRTRHRYKALIADSAAEVNALMVTVGLPGASTICRSLLSWEIPGVKIRNVGRINCVTLR